MAFTVEEFRDLMRLLEERPEWRAELRRAVLTDELLALPELVRALADAQRRTEVQVAALAEAQRRAEERLSGVEERLDRVEAQIGALADAQRRAEERLSEVEGRLSRVEAQIGALAEAQRRTEVQVAALAEAQRRAEERLSGVEERLGRAEERLSGVEERLGRVEAQIGALAEAQRRTEVQVAALAEAQRRTEVVVGGILVDLGELKGDSLERRYRERAPAYFARLVRRVRVLTGGQLLDLLEPAVERGQIQAHEAQEVALADVVIRGRRREDNAEVYLVVEVSWSVDSRDVERAAQRAALMREAGLAAVPVVAGKIVLPEASERARELRVWQLTDGQVVVPE